MLNSLVSLSPQGNSGNNGNDWNSRKHPLDAIMGPQHGSPGGNVHQGEQNRLHRGAAILTKEEVGLLVAMVVLKTLAIKEGETSMAAGGSMEGAEGDSMEGVVVTRAEGEVVSKLLAADRDSPLHLGWDEMFLQFIEISSMMRGTC